MKATARLVALTCSARVAAGGVGLGKDSAGVFLLFAALAQHAPPAMPLVPALFLHTPF
jgi:hypothetical protein